MDVQRIFAPVSDELKQVERELARQVEQLARDPAVPVFPDAGASRIVRHVFAASGKRLRPALVLLSARAVGPVRGETARVLIELAAAVELIHTASLVHDDVIDEAELRRDRPSLNSRYGNKLAVLTGDLLYTRFFHIVAGLPQVAPPIKLRLLALFCTATRRMCLGEIVEEQARRSGAAVGFDRYRRINAAKTAGLMAGCCRAGALLNGAPEEAADALAAFGRHLGLAYQLMDDLVDLDAVFSLQDEMARELRECARRAQRAVRGLPDSVAVRHLLQFAEAILQEGAAALSGRATGR